MSRQSFNFTHFLNEFIFIKKISKKLLYFSKNSQPIFLINYFIPTEVTKMLEFKKIIIFKDFFIPDTQLKIYIFITKKRPNQFLHLPNKNIIYANI